MPYENLTHTLYEYCPRDWPEDAEHENGNYFNTCYKCVRIFTGHKRRTVCKVCSPHIKEQ